MRNSARQSNQTQTVVAVPAPIPPEDLITIEEMARRLRPDVSPEKGIAWVREKCRRRSPNPIPVHNLGRHLLFDWVRVSEWIRNLPRPVHASHRRRTKEQIEKDRKLKVVKKVA